MTAPEARAAGRAGPGAPGPLAASHRVRAVLGDLFPAGPEPAPRAGLARWGFVLIQAVVVAAGAVVMLARVSGRPVWNTVYGEDWGIYLPQAIAHPWHLLQSYAGYLQLVPRLIGQVSALVPVRQASVAFAVGGALVASSCGLFTYHASAGHISSRWLRVLLGLSVVLLPVAQLEIADNGVNTIWYLLATLFWAALWRPRARAGAAFAAVVAFATAASTSLALLYAPLFAARAVVVPRRPREHAATAGWAAGSLLQVAVIVTSHLSRLVPRDPRNVVLFYAHDVLLPALGWHFSWDLRDAVGLTGATMIMGVVIVVILTAAVVTQPGRCRVFVVTAVATGLVFSTVTSAIAWGGSTLPVTPRLEHGARYSTLPILLLDAALIVAADTYARRRWPHPKAVAAVAALTAVLAAGWVTDFRYPVRHVDWSGSVWEHKADKWLRRCQQYPAGTISVTFHNQWGKTKATLVTTFSCSSLRR